MNGGTLRQRLTAFVTAIAATMDPLAGFWNVTRSGSRKLTASLDRLRRYLRNLSAAASYLTGLGTPFAVNTATSARAFTRAYP